MSFIPTTWVNLSEPGITAEQLNRIEQGIVDAHKVGYINATWFDSAADDAAMIQAAIDEAIALGKPVYLPAGTYTLDRDITLSAGVHVFGDGIDLTVIEATEPVDDMFAAKGVGVMKQNFRFEGMTLDGTGAFDCFEMEWCERLLFRNLRLTGYGSVGIDFGVFTSPSDANRRVTDVVIDNCRFEGNTSVDLIQVERARIQNCHLSGQVRSFGTRSLILAGNVSHDSGTPFLDIHASNGLFTQGVVVDGNLISDNISGFGVIHLSQGNSDVHMQITDNMHVDYGTATPVSTFLQANSGTYDFVYASGNSTAAADGVSGSFGANTDFSRNFRWP